MVHDEEKRRGGQIKKRGGKGEGRGGEKKGHGIDLGKLRYHELIPCVAV